MLWYSGDLGSWRCVKKSSTRPSLRPADFDESKPYPVLLNVHGGPFTQYGDYFFDEAQMQAAAGFVVVLGNPVAAAAVRRPGGKRYSVQSTRYVLAPVGAHWTSRMFWRLSTARSIATPSATVPVSA